MTNSVPPRQPRSVTKGQSAIHSATRRCPVDCEIDRIGELRNEARDQSKAGRKPDLESTFLEAVAKPPTGFIAFHENGHREVVFGREGGLHKARIDDLDGNVAAVSVEFQSLGERDDGGLARWVAAGIGEPAIPSELAHNGDLPAFARPHGVENRIHGVGRSLKIKGDRPREAFAAEVIRLVREVPPSVEQRERDRGFPLDSRYNGGHLATVGHVPGRSRDQAFETRSLSL